MTLLAVGIGLLLGFFFGPDDDAAGSPSPGASSPVAVASSAPAVPSAAASAAASPPVSPSAGAEASAPPPVVDPPSGFIPAGSVVRVLVDGLRMREEPSTEASLVDNLPVDQLLAVGYGPLRPDFGPVPAEDLDWYPVVRLGDRTELPPLSDGPITSRTASGWVAAGDASEPFVMLVDPRCPPRPVSLPVVEAMFPWERLACFGPEQITVEGVFGCGGCSGLAPGTFEPEWLAFPFSPDFLSVDPGARIGPFALRFRPSGPPEPAQGEIARVVGHLDDPAARDCAVAPGDPPRPLDGGAAAIFCREQFVVQSLEVLGTDPDFP
jgi:hypothetical protein